MRFKQWTILSLLWLLMFTGWAWGLNWHIEVVDAPHHFPDWRGSIAVDNSGKVHMAYGGDHLYYAYRDIGGWHTEVVDSSPGVGQYASLVLDKNGYPHIAYFDATNMDLKYAYWDGNNWQIERVDSGGNVGQYASLALDKNGYPYIAYYDGTKGDLKYAYWDGNNWQIETVDSAGAVGG